jgi:hypothetical protein
MADAVRIEGLAALRKDLRAMQPDARREVTKALKEGAVLVQRAAGPFTARKTGTLAGAWRAGASGNTAFVRNRVPYAGVLEFGGTIRPKGAPVVIKAHPAGTRALAAREDQIVDRIGDAIEQVAARHGW